MIHITKPAKAPAVLPGKGATQTQKDCAAYDNGTREFDFNSKIYGAKSVKKALINAQHKKCAFCESKVTHTAYGDVEHFRPKAAVKQSKNAKMMRPGYYWLAYDWSNLYFACQLCNQRFKKNLFPLSNAQGRARSHHEDVSREEPLFIDPGKEEPRDFIRFRKEMAYAVDNNRRGKSTIEGLGLNRIELAELRFDRYKTLRMMYGLANGVPTDAKVEEAKAWLEERSHKQSEFSSMNLSALTDEFRV